jgi:hypothetical protein
MADFGFNFRQTAGGVAPLTDGANETYVLASDTTPTTRNGIGPFQWDTNLGLDARDRLTSGDVRMAGICFVGNAAAERYFSFTLPATGDYILRAAFGDGTGGQTQYIRFKEGTTTYKTIAGVVSNVNEFVDANGVLRTSQALWISNNVSISRTFTTTDCRVYIGDPAFSGGNNSTIAHLFVSQVGGGGGSSLPVFTNQYRQRRA